MEALAQVGNDSKLKSEVETKLQEVSPLHFPALHLQLNDQCYSIAQRVKGWYSYRAAVRNSRHESGVWFQALLVGQIINKNNDKCVKTLLPGH